MDQAQLESVLKQYGQEHVMRHWSQLDENGRKALIQQVAAIDFPELLASCSGSGHGAGPDWKALAARAELPPAVRTGQPHGEFTPEQARQAGEAALKAGRVAVLLVAGGQATRLGFSSPKGLYPVGPISEASLFQIFCEQILALQRRYGSAIPLYLMTSTATDRETQEFFAKNDNFGLPADQVFFFKQGLLPAIDAKTGKLLLAAPGQLALSPDGHGGILEALQQTGMYDKMVAQGIDYLFYLQVDNPLVKVCDPEFIGYHILTRSQITAKVVAKNAPMEKVGNVVTVDGRMQIIEYSDLSADLAERTAPDGSPIFWAGNIAVHVFDRDFIAAMTAGGRHMPLHVAHKKVAYLGDDDQPVEPTQPNAYKMERFIFDVFPEAERVLVVETSRDDEFAPLKNATGDSSPETVKQQIVSLARKMLTEAGAIVATEAPVEISPLFALDVEELRGKLTPGAQIDRPTYLK
ncbi:MAG TPA: UDPGP type 1 family protein [Pirellulales bacterium]